jgi:hypothetical protein
MCEPEQEASESRSGTVLERQFLTPAGNRMLVPRRQVGCQRGVISLHNSCRQGSVHSDRLRVRRRITPAPRRQARKSFVFVDGPLLIAGKDIS